MGWPGRRWALDLADRVLLVAVYWRMNLTMRQIGPVYGVSRCAAHRVIDALGPLLALALIRRRRADQAAIVGRHAGAHEGPAVVESVEELPVFDERAGRDRHRHPHHTSPGPHPRRTHLGPHEDPEALRDYRRRASTLYDTAAGIAYLSNLAHTS